MLYSQEPRAYMFLESHGGVSGSPLFRVHTDVCGQPTDADTLKANYDQWYQQKGQMLDVFWEAGAKTRRYYSQILASGEGSLPNSYGRLRPLLRQYDSVSERFLGSSSFSSGPIDRLFFAIRIRLGNYILRLASSPIRLTPKVQLTLTSPRVSAQVVEDSYRDWLTAGNCPNSSDSQGPGGGAVVATAGVSAQPAPARDPNARRSMLASIDITTPPRTTPSVWWDPLINAARFFVGGAGRSPGFGGGTVGVMPVGVPSVVAPTPVMAR